MGATFVPDQASEINTVITAFNNNLSASDTDVQKSLDTIDNIIHYYRGILGSAPSSPQEGWTYINSGDNKLYIYYGGTWQELHTLTPAALSYLLLETGDTLLLETGDKLALEA